MEMKREVIRGRVFQPGHRLPTMSLEALADMELQDALERQARAKYVFDLIKRHRM
jgi:hypothetical protein